MTKEATKTQLIRFDWAMKIVLQDKANFDILKRFFNCFIERRDVCQRNI